MASLRGSAVIWSNFAVTGTGAGTDLSPEVNIGSGVNVVLFITNTTSTSGTFQLQVSMPASGQTGAGLNIAPNVWYPYATKDAPSTIMNIVVAGSTSVAIDLSPFSPEYLRLASTLGSTTVSAYVASIGVN